MDTAPIVILSHIRHAAITDGFLPAAVRLGLPVVLLTDHRLEHVDHFRRQPLHAPAHVVECDVFNPLGVIDVLRTLEIRPAAVFSNSDHLQASAATVAKGLGLPGKDWRVCYAAKNKAAMRERLRELGLPTPWFHCWAPGQPRPDVVDFPVVAKPREGVASMDVRLCISAAELDAFAEHYWGRFPDRTILLEGYLAGPLFTLETLGDGRLARPVGGFDVRLSDAPHFIELEAHWNGPVGLRHREQAMAQVLAFGVGLGACHSEFVLTERGPVLVEINYRSIGDGREFLLDRMFDGRWFEHILRLHLGQPLDLGLATRRQARVRYYPAERDGRLTDAPSTNRHSTAGAEAEYRSLRAVGDEIRLSCSNKDYLGALSVVADDAAALEQALTSVDAGLRWTIETPSEACA